MRGSRRPRNSRGRKGLSFAEAMRMLADAAVAADAADAAAAHWSRVSAGPWLADTLKACAAPDGAGSIPARRCTATLRPYQKAGVQWLHLLTGLGLGACLADDMGLGKTIQVLALLLVQRQRSKGEAAAVPAGGAGLAAGQLGRGNRAVRPDLAARILHPSAMTAGGQGVHAGGRRKARSGDHQLWHAAAHAGAGRDRVAAADPRRGAGDQEPERQADPRRQGAARRGRGSR